MTKNDGAIYKWARCGHETSLNYQTVIIIIIIIIYFENINVT